MLIGVRRQNVELPARADLLVVHVFPELERVSPLVHPRTSQRRTLEQIDLRRRDFAVQPVERNRHIAADAKRRRLEGEPRLLPCVVHMQRHAHPVGAGSRCVHLPRPVAHPLLVPEERERVPERYGRRCRRTDAGDDVRDFKSPRNPCHRTAALVALEALQAVSIRL